MKAFNFNNQRYKKRDLSKYDPKFRRARIWSNIELKKITPIFTGDVINVSGWADEDKEGKTYKEYFKRARSYTISNLGGGAQKGKEKTLKDSIDIDLNQPLDSKYHQKFDVVFNHTVLEHVFNIFKAVENLCSLSRDIIITVVPFMQLVHLEPEENYLDYWRFTPYCLDSLFSIHNYKTLLIKGLNIEKTSVYYLHICSKKPKKWIKQFPHEIDFKNLPKGENFY